MQTIETDRGKLTVIEKLPFPIKRVYYLHGINPDVQRPGHAHKKLDRLMMAVSGSFKVLMRERGQIFWHDVTLNDPEKGLRIPPMAWVELKEFSKDAVCLVLASEEYDETDVIRDYTEFVRARKCSA